MYFCVSCVFIIYMQVGLKRNCVHKIGGVIKFSATLRGRLVNNVWETLLQRLTMHTLISVTVFFLRRFEEPKRSLKIVQRSLKICYYHSRTCRGCRGGNCPPKFRRFGKIKIFQAVRRKYLGKTIVFRAAI